MTLSIPRDRAGTFDPKLIAKCQRRFPDFDDKIISMYACGMSVREIRGHYEELYGIDASADLISSVIGGGHGMTEPTAGCLLSAGVLRRDTGQNRDEDFVRNRPSTLRLAFRPDGTKETLGIWIEQTEGAKFWLRVMNELKNRGIGDILIASSTA
jgi:putative transposase